MNTSITPGDHFVVEVRRYDTPQMTYRFFYWEPATEEHKIGSHMFSNPFANLPRWQRLTEGYDRGMTYVESERHQVNSVNAEGHRTRLQATDYVPVDFRTLPVQFQDWLIHTVCPIEWHQVMDGEQNQLRDETDSRIVVWIHAHHTERENELSTAIAEPKRSYRVETEYCNLVTFKHDHDRLKDAIDEYVRMMVAAIEPERLDPAAKHVRKVTLWKLEDGESILFTDPEGNVQPVRVETPTFGCEHLAAEVDA